MNDQQIRSIGNSIDVFISDTQRRLHQLQTSMRSVDTMFEAEEAASAQHKAANRDVIPPPEAAILRKKLELIRAADLGDKVGDLAADIDELARQILNGNPVPGERRECLAVQQGGLLFSCSGLLIHERWAITSAHCTAPTRIYIGDDVFDGIVGHSVFDVVDEGLVGAGLEVRLLRIIGSIPNPAIATLAYGADFAVGTPGTIVGFGASVPGGVRGIKRAGGVLIASQNPLTTTPGPPPTGADATFGDSGGPLIVEENGKQVVYGLIEQGLRTADTAGTVYVKIDKALVGAIEEKTKVALRKYPSKEEIGEAQAAEKRSSSSGAKQAKPAKEKKTRVH